MMCHANDLLAEHVAALKCLENAAEDARKDGYEDELDDRIDVGESVGPLSKVSGSNTGVGDAADAFAAVADQGEDPLDVATVKISALRDVLGREADEYIDEASYTYFRRQG